MIYLWINSMEILPPVLLIIIVIFVSVQYKISLIKIFILSILPSIMIYPLLLQFFLEDSNNLLIIKNLDEIIAVVQGIFMIYTVAFCPSISSSVMILYLKQQYPMKLFKLFSFTILIIFFNTLLYIFYIIQPFFHLPLNYVYILLTTSLVTGTLSVAIFHYFTAIIHYLTEHKKENND